MCDGGVSLHDVKVGTGGAGFNTGNAEMFCANDDSSIDAAYFSNSSRDTFISCKASFCSDDDNVEIRRSMEIDSTETCKESFNSRNVQHLVGLLRFDEQPLHRDGISYQPLEYNEGVNLQGCQLLIFGHHRHLQRLKPVLLLLLQRYERIDHLTSF